MYFFFRSVTKIVLSLLFTPSDVNECEYITESCGNNAECFNTNGSYYCQCKHGFKNHKETVNFTAANGQCLGVCVYVCLCVTSVLIKWSDSSPFALLSDDNECLDSVNICGLGGNCSNRIGSYECICQFGYTNRANNSREPCIGEFFVH